MNSHEIRTLLLGIEKKWKVQFTNSEGIKQDDPTGRTFGFYTYGHPAPSEHRPRTILSPERVIFPDPEQHKGINTNRTIVEISGMFYNHDNTETQRFFRYYLDYTDNDLSIYIPLDLLSGWLTFWNASNDGKVMIFKNTRGHEVVFTQREEE